MRYVAMLRRNGLRHQIDIVDVSFSDTTPQFRDLDAAQAAAIERAIDAADAKDGKCPGIKAHLVFVPESDLKGGSVDDYLNATAPKPPPKDVRRGVKAKAPAAPAAKAEGRFKGGR